MKTRSNLAAQKNGFAQGPDVYRLAQAHRAEAVATHVERVLHTPVARIERDSVAGSHAVFFVGLQDGRECVARVATHPDHDLALQLWVTERCRSLGLPVPETLAADLAPADGSPPLMLARRMPGRPAHDVLLSPPEREGVLEQMGRYAARIHSLKLPRFGPLRAAGDDYAGRCPSLSGYLLEDIAQKLGQLPDAVLAPQSKAALRDRFAREHALLERPAGVLLHGDYRLKNVLLDGPRVSAILDFEMALSGDPAMDIASLLYSDGREQTDLAAVLRGYDPGGRPEGGVGFARRLVLYQLRYALEHLWWEVSFQDEAGVGAVSRRVHALEQALDSRVGGG